MAKKVLKLDDDVRGVLARSAVEGTTLRLPEQLDRALYTKTNKALEALGGRWDRKRKGHVFDGDPRAAISAASDTGAVAHPNPDDFFPTPRDVADLACAYLAMGGAWKRTLEPSAGEGHLIAPLVEQLGHPTGDGDLQLFEKDPKRAAVLRAKGITTACVQEDFLAVDPKKWKPFDRIIMNPPFHRGADTTHVAHALDFLAPGGRLVAIVSAAFDTRGSKIRTKASGDLLKRLDSWGASFEDLPAGSFKASGTNVATKLLVVDCLVDA